MGSKLSRMYSEADVKDAPKFLSIVIGAPSDCQKCSCSQCSSQSGSYSWISTTPASRRTILYLAFVRVGSIVDGSCLPGFGASTSRLRICPTLFEVSLAPDLDQFGSGAIERPLKVHLLAF